MAACLDCCIVIITTIRTQAHFSEKYLSPPSDILRFCLGSNSTEPHWIGNSNVHYLNPTHYKQNCNACRLESESQHVDTRRGDIYTKLLNLICSLPISLRQVIDSKILQIHSDDCRQEYFQAEEKIEDCVIYFGVTCETYRKKSPQFICFAVLMPLVASFGILGNVLILVVLTRKEMTSPTHRFLTALAVSDMLLLVVNIPRFLAYVPSMWHISSVISFYNHYFVAVHGLSSIFRISTCWLTTAVAVDRYISFRFKLSRPHLVCTLKRANVAVAVIFSLSISFNIVTFLELEPQEVSASPWPLRSSLGSSTVYMITIFVIDSIISIFIPIIVMIYCNVCLLRFLIIHRRRMAQFSSSVYSVDVLQVGIVVFTVVLIFLLCFSLNILRCLNTFTELVNDTTIISVMYIFPIDYLLIIVNSSVNIVVYTCVNQKFRKTLCAILRKCCTTTTSEICSA